MLLKSATRTLDDIVGYIGFATECGVDNVVFRQLMLSDPRTHIRNDVVRYSARERVRVAPLLQQIAADPRFEFRRQVVGYYYYVEVWRCGGADVVFEEADLARLEFDKRANPHVIHELVFHPNGVLSSTWQPWDGILGPP